MNNGAFGENFPYSNFHDLNLDWIIKIAKEFLDKYEGIQDTITEGQEGLEADYERLSGLLNEWYTTHSEDIANELTEAIASLNATSAQLVSDIIASIPQDYTALSNQVNDISKMVSSAVYKESISYTWYSTGRYVKKSDGRTNASESWMTTTFIHLPSGMLGINYSQACSTNGTALSTIASVAFYEDSADIETFISAEGIYSSEQGLKDHYISVPDNAKYMRLTCPVSFTDRFYVNAVYDFTTLIDNDDIKIRTRLAHTNASKGFGPDCMLISLKRSVFLLGVDNNGHWGQTAPEFPYDATANAYFWLMNHASHLFATNCNFSGGYTSEEIRENHYALRYNGTNYLASPTEPRNARNFLCIDTANQTFALYPYESTNVVDIPANYNYAFAAGIELIRNGEIVYPDYDTPQDTSERSQRMVFGWDNNYFHIFFCEGRNNVCAGMTRTELIKRLVAWGVTNAVNLDGGGSVCCAVNMKPNTLKINEHVDANGIRVTTLNMNYKYTGKNQALSVNAIRAILAYVADAFHPYREDLLGVLSEISGQNVGYHYDNETKLWTLGME